MRFGFHVSISGGWQKTLQRAIQRRCTALQVFTSAPVQWARAPLDSDDARWFAETLAVLDIQPLFVHAIYLLNLATGDSGLWRKSRDHLAEELARAGRIGAEGVVLHLGSVGRRGQLQIGIKRVAKALDEALDRCDSPVKVLLENCAGQGNLVGSTPEQIGDIIDLSTHPQRLGVCIDTAHAFAQGYAIHAPGGLAAFLDTCENTFGLRRLQLIHANDSKTALGSRADRHGHIGKGEIGTAGFRTILNEPRLREMPFIMETPEQETWHQRDMRAIRRVVDAAIRPALPPIRRVPPRGPR